jgi:hypothetical protein
MLWNNGGWASNRGGWTDQVKHIHSWDTSRNPLNIDFEINNERQDCKTVIVLGGYIWEGGGEWR